MKFAVVFTACMALLAMQVVGGSEVVPKVGKLELTILKVQQFFYEILLRLDDNLQFDEWINIGDELITDKKYYSVYDKDMQTYVNLYLGNNLQPTYGFFNPMQPCYIQEVKGLFKFFYYPRDLEIVLRNMAWARIHANRGVFVQALTLVVTHHKELKNLVIPEIDEIFPKMFVDGKQVEIVEKLDWDMWNRWIMMEKEIKATAAQKIPSLRFGAIKTDFKLWQWWKIMNLSDGWQLEKMSMLRDDYEVIREDPTFKSIYSEMKMLWIPVDYSRNIEMQNDDSMLTYFTEDRSWNKYWYYLNMECSTVFNSEEFGLDDRLGEWWLFNVQQIVARFNMERISNGFYRIEPITWNEVFSYGYNPQLVALNGEEFVERDNNFELNGEHNPLLFNNILSVQTKIRDLLIAGQFLKNGTKIDLTDVKSMRFIGNLMQGSIDFMGMRPWFPMVSSFIGGADYDSCGLEPNVMVNYETQLRDPFTYRMFKSMIDIADNFKQNYPPHTREELALPGVEIVDVDISELKTYIDLVDIDMSTLCEHSMVFIDEKYVWDKVALGRQSRLNHEPFDFKIKVHADKPQKVAVRVFLGPLINTMDEVVDISDNAENFMKIDQFVYDLAAGSNTIERSSNDFTWTKNDSYTYSELYAHLSLAMEGKMEFNPKMYASRSLFPQRLLLPRGRTEGLPVALFFYIGPYQAPSNPRYFDDLPFAFPLERPIPTIVNFAVPNMFYKISMVYHKIDKFSPDFKKYLGVFDKTFA